MKCALELTAIRKMADIAWAEEEAKKDAKAQKDYEVACANAIDYCENILDSIFTRMALNREKIEYTHKIVVYKDRIGNQLFKFVEPDGRKYANGELSYAPCGDFYSWKTFVNHLHAHCFAIKCSSNNYMNYGSGSKNCEYMVITMK